MIPTKEDGARAAFIGINNMLYNAGKQREAYKVNKGSASFKEGYWQGLLAASCFSAFFDHPEMNVKDIEQLLEQVKK